MNEVIICNIDTFTADNPIYLCDENHHTLLGMAQPENITEQLTNFAQSRGVNNIHLFGLKDYVSFIKDGVLEYAALNYNNNELNVEVN